MTVIAIGRDDLVAVTQRQLHANDNRFLTDIEVAETADQAHPVKLSGLFLEPADQQHAAIGFQQGIPVHRLVFGFAAFSRLGCLRHVEISASVASPFCRSVAAYRSSRQAHGV